MKAHKYISIIFSLIPLVILSQGLRLLPAELPESIYGAWQNDKKQISLIITSEYIVIQNELFYYNDIVKELDEINFICVNDLTEKKISISHISNNSFFLDEGFRITHLTKLISKNVKQIPGSLQDIWRGNNNNLQLQVNNLQFSKNQYLVDYYAASSNNDNYCIVTYFKGDYYLLYNTIADGESYLRANFKETILFKKATFYQKYKKSILFVVVFAAVFLIYFLVKWKMSVTKKKEQTKRRFAEVELKSIRSQMNPHFMFNALSAIQNLINKGENEKANYYLIEFSQLMRLTLNKSEQGIVPLADEITSIKKYLELEKLRFNFDYTIEIAKDLSTKSTEIPAMLIQPFVENSIIHGLLEKNGPKALSIDFKKKEDHLICKIKDNGIGIEASKAKKKKHYKGEKFGLKLAEDRITLINETYKTSAYLNISDISDKSKNITGTVVEITMPLHY